MPSARTTTSVAVVVAFAAVVAAAASVERGLPPAVVVERTRPVSGGALSLYGLLAVLVVRLLSLVGVDAALAAPGGAAPALLAVAADTARAVGPVLVAGGIVATVAWVAVRARQWQRAASAAQRRTVSSTAAASDDKWPPSQPTNDVEANWVAAVADTECESPGSMTPRELADAKADEGAPKSAIAELTQLFRAVRYGSRRATAERAARAAALAATVRDGDGEADGD
jgi:hypothetical protein